MLKKIIKSPALYLLSVAVLFPLPAFAQTCDRACLEALLDTSLDAVIANDPAAVPLSSDGPGTVEMFKVENGKPGEIEALLQQVPYGILSGWSSYEDGMSSALRDVTLKIK